MRRLFVFPLAIAFSLSSPAWAKDKKDQKEEDDFEAPEKVDESAFKDDEEDDAPATKRIDEADSEGAEDAPDDLDFTDDGQEEDADFRDDEVQESTRPRGPGEDSADIYRKAQEAVRDLAIDEELLAWEKYLEKYPKSLFRDRIEARTEELSAELFDERVPGSDKGSSSVRDGASRELNFANPIQFSPVDPRSRLSVGFEMGIPNWLAPRIDFEYALKREFSVHGGVRREMTNTAILAGGKYALLKSARTNTIVTGALDVKVYAGPSFVDLNPWIGVGQRFDVLDGLDLQAQFGVDAELRDPAGLRYNAGLAAELRAAEIVSAFAETSMTFKYLGNDDYGPFRFMVTTFGLRFRGAKERNADGDGRLDVGLGANLPYSINYWGFYRGAVSIDADYAL